MQEQMDHIMVSVIMPAYNVEKYIVSCLDSVLNQSVRNIEVICVEDASTDRTPEIIEKYRKADERVKVVSYGKNMGLAYARNRGLEVARGKYVYFLDSDDLVKPCIFEKLIECAELHKTDCVYFDSEMVFVDRKTEDVEKLQFGLSGIEGQVLRGEDLFVRLINNGTYTNAVWRQFWNHDFLNKTNITFIDCLLSEDTYFSVIMMLKSNRCVYLNEVLHTYRRRGDSLTSNRSAQLCISLFKIYCRLLKFWNENHFPDDVNQAMDKYLCPRLERARKFYYRNKNKISEDDFESGVEQHLYKYLLANENTKIHFRVSDEDMLTLKNADEIMIYGDGNYAVDVIIFLTENNIKVDAIAITQKKIYTSSINDLPIYDIDELEASHKNATIVLGVKSDKMKQEIIETLQSRNINTIINLKEEHI